MRLRALGQSTCRISWHSHLFLFGVERYVIYTPPKEWIEFLEGSLTKKEKENDTLRSITEASLQTKNVRVTSLHWTYG